MTKTKPSPHQFLPSVEAMDACLDKENNGLLIVELNQDEAKELRSYIRTLTFGDLIHAEENVPAALHKIYVALTNTSKLKGVHES